MDKEQLNALLQSTKREKCLSERLSIQYYEQSMQIANEFTKMKYILAKDLGNMDWLKEYYVNLCGSMNNVVCVLLKYENFKFKKDAMVDERFDTPEKCILEMNQKKENVESLFLTQIKNNEPEL